MLDVQTIEMILQFLGRTQFVGTELPQLVHVHNKLSEARLQLLATQAPPPPASPVTPPAATPSE